MSHLSAASYIRATSGAEDYKQVVLTARSHRELRREVAGYESQRWQVAAIFQVGSADKGRIHVVIVLERRPPVR